MFFLNFFFGTISVNLNKNNIYKYINGFYFLAISMLFFQYQRWKSKRGRNQLKIQTFSQIQETWRILRQMLGKKCLKYLNF